MHEDDYVLQHLKYLESCGSNWITHAKQVNKILSSTETQNRHMVFYSAHTSIECSQEWNL